MKRWRWWRETVVMAIVSSGEDEQGQGQGQTQTQNGKISKMVTAQRACKVSYSQIAYQRKRGGIGCSCLIL